MFELYENQFQKKNHCSNYFKLRKISDKNWTSAIKTSSMILAKSDNLHFPLEAVKGRTADC